MKLTQRFSLTHGLIALLTAVVILGMMVAGARLLFWKQVKTAEKQQMADFTLAAREAYFAHEDVAVLNFLKLAIKDETVAFVSFVNEKGQRLTLPPEASTQDLSTGEREWPAGRPLVVQSQEVMAEKKNAGTVCIAYDRAQIEKHIQAKVLEWLQVAAAASLVALVLAWVVSVLLAGNLARPLKRIRAGTHAVRSGKMDKLVDVDRADEIGDLARDFNDMVVQLKELDTMKRDFVAGVTHDFGTPLQAIKSGLEYLQEQKAGPLTPKQSEYLLLIANSTHQLTAFINDLLTTARIEAAKEEAFYEKTDALALAKEVTALYQPLAESKGLSLRLECATEKLFVVTDVTLFRQILTNMISNAMKYTEKGGAVVSLSVDGKDLIVQVKDTGIGIDPKNQVVIFDKFHRVRQSKGSAQQGAGLGLAIVKGLSETMGGTVSVESQEGAGALFTVRLPLKNLG